jgi:hypothetical protein
MPVSEKHRGAKEVVFADGKSGTVTTSGTDAEGKDVKNTAVYDKQ